MISMIPRLKPTFPVFAELVAASKANNCIFIFAAWREQLHLCDFLMTDVC